MRKFDKIDDEISKIRNEVFTIKNNLDLNIKQTSTHNDQIDSIFILIEEMKIKCNNHKDLNDKAMKEQLSNLQDYINNKFKE